MDDKRLRRYLGRLGDEAVPSPGFEDLSLQVLEVGAVPSNSRRGLVLAIAAAAVVFGGIGYIAQSGDGPESVVLDGAASSTTSTVATVTTAEYIRVELCEVDELLMLPDASAEIDLDAGVIRLKALFRNSSGEYCTGVHDQSFEIFDLGGTSLALISMVSDLDAGGSMFILPGGSYVATEELRLGTGSQADLSSNLLSGRYRVLVTVRSFAFFDEDGEHLASNENGETSRSRTYSGEFFFEIREEDGLAENESQATTTAATTTTVATTTTAATATTTTTSPSPIPLRMCTNDELILLPNGAGSSILVESDMVSITAVYKNESSSACTRPSRWFVEVWSNSGEYQQGFEDGLVCATAPGCLAIGPGGTDSATFVWDRTVLDRETNTTSAAMPGEYNVAVAVAVFQTVTVDFEPIELPDGHSFESRHYTGMIYFEIP